MTEHGHLAEDSRSKRASMDSVRSGYVIIGEDSEEFEIVPTDATRLKSGDDSPARNECAVPVLHVTPVAVAIADDSDSLDSDSGAPDEASTSDGGLKSDALDYDNIRRSSYNRDERIPDRLRQTRMDFEDRTTRTLSPNFSGAHVWQRRLTILPEVSPHNFPPSDPVELPEIHDNQLGYPCCCYPQGPGILDPFSREHYPGGHAMPDNPREASRERRVPKKNGRTPGCGRPLRGARNFLKRVKKFFKKK